MVHVCDQNDDIEKFDLNNIERIFVRYSSCSKAYPAYKNVCIEKYVYVSLYKLGRIKKLQKKDDPYTVELLQIHRDGLNRALLKNILFMNPAISTKLMLNEVDAADDLDEGPSPLDCAEQR